MVNPVGDVRLRFVRTRKSSRGPKCELIEWGYFVLEKREPSIEKKFSDIGIWKRANVLSSKREEKKSYQAAFIQLLDSFNEAQEFHRYTSLI